VLLFVVYILLQPKKYKIDEVVFNNEIAYLKHDMSKLNGKISGSLYKGLFVNGLKEGFWRELYENGQLKQEGNYIDGKKKGFFRQWHENGQLQWEGNYVNEKWEGLWRNWNENGQLNTQVNYVNGVEKYRWNY